MERYGWLIAGAAFVTGIVVVILALCTDGPPTPPPDDIDYGGGI